MDRALHLCHSRCLFRSTDFAPFRRHAGDHGVGSAILDPRRTAGDTWRPVHQGKTHRTVGIGYHPCRIFVTIRPVRLQLLCYTQCKQTSESGDHIVTQPFECFNRQVFNLHRSVCPLLHNKRLPAYFHRHGYQLGDARSYLEYFHHVLPFAVHHQTSEQMGGSETVMRSSICPVRKFVPGRAYFIGRIPGQNQWIH